MKVCPECGSEHFVTTGIEYHDWIVDGEGNFTKDISCYDANLGENEWYCHGCQAEFSGPHELKEVTA